ncbi:Uncharacterised protein [Candidatus Burarchaeum australiense]|nr:Uncharacterised protein [Candidatus Burarchaeum australiense]
MAPHVEPSEEHVCDGILLVKAPHVLGDHHYVLRHVLEYLAVVAPERVAEAELQVLNVDWRVLAVYVDVGYVLRVESQVFERRAKAYAPACRLMRHCLRLLLAQRNSHQRGLVQEVAPVLARPLLVQQLEVAGLDVLGLLHAAHDFLLQEFLQPVVEGIYERILVDVEPHVEPRHVVNARRYAELERIGGVRRVDEHGILGHVEHQGLHEPEAAQARKGNEHLPRVPVFLHELVETRLGYGLQFVLLVEHEALVAVYEHSPLGHGLLVFVQRHHGNQRALEHGLVGLLEDALALRIAVVLGPAEGLGLEREHFERVYGLHVLVDYRSLFLVELDDYFLLVAYALYLVVHQRRQCLDVVVDELRGK